MTEAEALDMAAEASWWGSWGAALRSANRGVIEAIRAHAKTIMQNAALKAEVEALKALRDDDGELLTIAWMGGAHRSNKAHREQIAALKAENERLREALGNLINAYTANVDTYRIAGFYTDPETEDEIIEARTALERIDRD